MEEELELSDYYNIIRKNIGLIIAVFVVILGAAILYNAFSAPVYEGKSSVFVDSYDIDSILSNRQDIKLDIDTQVEIITRTIIPEVIAQYPQFEEVEVFVTPVQQTSIIEIRTLSRNKFNAKDAANIIAETYFNYTIDQKKLDARDIVDLVTIRITEYQAELELLNKELLAYESIENRSDEKEIEYQNLLQTISVKKELYNYLLKRKEEESLIASESSSNVKIIERAELEVFPVRPRVLLNILIGIFLGIIAGVGAAFLKEYIMNTYSGMKDIEKDFGPIVMGTLPRLDKHSKNSYIVQFRKPDSTFSEYTRMLRTNIMFYLKDKNMKLLSVVSPQRKDGKTTAAANLAVSLAQNKVNVLLVDANIRNPMLDYVFKIKKKTKGLTEVILGDISLQKAISKTELPHLNFISAGDPNTSPSELLSSNKIKDICEQLKKSEFDAVIFDNSSLEWSESRFMAANTEGVLMVVAANKTKKENAQKAKKALEKVKANLIGVILNYHE